MPAIMGSVRIAEVLLIRHPLVLCEKRKNAAKFVKETPHTKERIFISRALAEENKIEQVSWLWGQYYGLQDVCVGYKENCFVQGGTEFTVDPTSLADYGQLTQIVTTVTKKEASISSIDLFFSGGMK